MARQPGDGPCSVIYWHERTNSWRILADCPSRTAAAALAVSLSQSCPWLAVELVPGLIPEALPATTDPLETVERIAAALLPLILAMRR
jgi:hypothetical protein